MSELDEPTAVLRHPAGHFIAHFYDEESGWYTANDSVVARRGCGPSSLPIHLFLRARGFATPLRGPAAVEARGDDCGRSRMWAMMLTAVEMS